MKQLFFILLTLSLLGTMSVNGQFEYATNADGESITITGYYGTNNAVSIPSTIEGMPVVNIADEAFYLNENISSVSIPGSVTNIGISAFYQCYSLGLATLSNGLLNIGEDAFGGCSGLTNAAIPQTVMCIGDGAFVNTSITTVAIPPQLISIGDFEFGGTGLTNITIPPSVQSIGAYAFYNCYALPSVTIPSNVTNIAAFAFGACGNLNAINVSTQNQHYSSIGGVLFDQSERILIQLPNNFSGSYAVPDGVTNIADNAFWECVNLGSISFPGSLLDIGSNAFFYCTGLTNVTIADGLKTIGYFAFNTCYSLPSLHLPKSVATVGAGAFEYCYGLTNIYFSGDAPTTDPSAFQYDISTTAYYLPGTGGWDECATNTDLPTVLWNPQIQIGDGNFGVRGNQFGFDITGTANIPIVLQACTNLSIPFWVSLQSLTLTNGLVYISEPFKSNLPTRFYRISSP